LLLPAQVASVLSRPSHAIWLIPTADFQIAHYSHRDWVREILAECGEPDVAFLTGWNATFVSRNGLRRRHAPLIFHYCELMEVERWNKMQRQLPGTFSSQWIYRRSD
jgi:hypothetical protein